MNALHASILFIAFLFPGMMLAVEFGRRLGVKLLKSDPESEKSGFGAMEGAVFALLGLLIAFTFSGASSRFEDRRQMILKEANNIGTAWLRLDLLPATAQPALRDLFRQYVDSRLAAYRVLPDIQAARAELARSSALQGEIWSKAVAASQASGSPSTATLLLPALNDMFDIVTARSMAMSVHPPLVIFGMLAVLTLMASAMAGFDMAGSKHRSWLHIIGFAFVMALTIYVILDLEFPRLGLLRIDAVDKLLMEVRQTMN